MPKLLTQVRELICVRHYSRRTEQAYVHWIKQFIFFYKKRRPAEMGAAEVVAFLSHLSCGPTGRRVHPKPGPGGNSVFVSQRLEAGFAVARKCRKSQKTSTASSSAVP
jgi:Phage integrase, N-terminal SAM-like domain